MAVWWGLKDAKLTATKCSILTRSVSRWRSAYRDGKLKRLRAMYEKDKELLGYLTAFGPRYAYTTYFLLRRCKLQHKMCQRNGALTVTLIGGGSAIELVGLIEYLYERQTPPRDLQVHFIDRSPQWRRFHSYLFGLILPATFPKTRVLPFYHDVDLSDPLIRYDRGLAQVFDSRVFMVSNVLSEFAESTAIKRQMRFLMRCATTKFYFLMADSNARKVRPRLSWIPEFVRSLGFPYYEDFRGEYTIATDWLQADPTTRRIFPPGGPTFMKEVKRQGYAARVQADSPGQRLLRRPRRVTLLKGKRQ